MDQQHGGALRTLSGAAQIAGTVVTAPILRRRYNRWGATDAEVRASLPGDDLVPSPRIGYTRAITIEAPLADVWPWVVQMGQGRGGFYSYDGLENLVRCNITSADRILPEHQSLQPGDVVRLGPTGYPCFQAVLVEPPTDLVLLGADPQPPHELGSVDKPPGVATWQWALRPTPDGATRLIARQRLAYPDRFGPMWHIVEPIGFVMEKQMLMGIKARAER